MLAAIGGRPGLEALDADVQRGLVDGRYDPRDMPVVIYCLQRWFQ